MLRARKEADSLGATVESPAASKDRWRVLPGKLPGREDLAGRIAVIEERLGARADLVAQVGACQFRRRVEISHSARDWA